MYSFYGPFDGTCSEFIAGHINPKLPARISAESGANPFFCHHFIAPPWLYQNWSCVEPVSRVQGLSQHRVWLYSTSSSSQLCPASGKLQELCLGTAHSFQCPNFRLFCSWFLQASTSCRDTFRYKVRHAYFSVYNGVTPNKTYGKPKIPLLCQTS